MFVATFISFRLLSKHTPNVTVTWPDRSSILRVLNSTIQGLVSSSYLHSSYDYYEYGPPLQIMLTYTRNSCVVRNGTGER